MTAGEDLLNSSLGPDQINENGDAEMKFESPIASEINIDLSREKMRLELGHASLMGRAQSSSIEPDRRGDSNKNTLIHSEPAMNNVSYLPDFFST